ncbi:MAG TPA: hypothetical protein VFQ61_01605 [Polyangiaceae bacterium]|nr:hypothetical protein [Polyangiaceae bacterium]
MRNILVLSGCVLALACASRETPPATDASSSSTVDQATESPNNGPDFTPTSPDGAFGAKADGTAADATSPNPSQKPTDTQGAGMPPSGTGTSGTGTSGAGTGGPADTSPAPNPRR